VTQQASKLIVDRLVLALKSVSINDEEKLLPLLDSVKNLPNKAEINEFILNIIT